MAQQTDHIGDTNKMVTAVEWLVEQIFPFGVEVKFKFDAIQQAKAMEKEQIIKAINEVSENNVKYVNMIIASWSQIEGELFMHNTKQAEQYYNETFNK